MDLLKYSGGKFLINDIDIDTKIDTVNEAIADVSANVNQFDTTDSPEFIDVTLDSSSKVIDGITTDGVKRVYIPSCNCGLKSAKSL